MDTKGLLLSKQLSSIGPGTTFPTLFDYNKNEEIPNLTNSKNDEFNDFENLDYSILDDDGGGGGGGVDGISSIDSNNILKNFIRMDGNDNSLNNNNNYINNNFNLLLNNNSKYKFNDSLNKLIDNFTNNNDNNNNNNSNINYNYIYDNSIIDTTIINTNFNNFNNNNNNNIFNNNNINNNHNNFTLNNVHYNNNYQPSDFDLLYRHSITMTIVYCIAYIIVFIVGLVGNSFVIAVVLRAPRMRTVTNFFIVNLAIADILVIVFCLPATLMGNIFVPWVLGWLMCKTVPYIQGVSVAASVYSLIAVSLDRFIAIWWPLKQMTKSRARFMIFCIWIIALSSTIPWALFFELVPAMEAFPAAPGMLLCVEVWPPGTDGNLYFLLANLVTCYLLPMALITLCYVLIWIKVSTRSIPGDSKDAQMDRMQQKSKVKVVKMLVAVVILFVLSWLPLYAIFARIKFGGEITQDEGEILNTITPMAQWLGSSNSCINPILYAFFNKKYRRGFAAIIKSRTCCGRLRYYDNVAIVSSSSTRKSSHYQNGTKRGPNSPSTKSNAVSYIYEHNNSSTRKHNIVVKQDSNISQQTLFKQNSHGSRQMLIKQESSCSDASRQLLLKQDSSGSRNSLVKQDSVISYIETKRGQLIRQDSDISKQDTISIDSKRGILSKQDLQISCIDNNYIKNNTNRNNFINNNSNKNSFSSQDSCASLIEHKRHRLVKQDSIISFGDQKPEPRRHKLVKQDSVISFADQKRGFLNKQDSVIAYPNNNRNGDVGHHVSILKKTDSQNSSNNSPRRNIEFAE